MITVSNGVEKFTIRKEMIKKVERGSRVSPDDYYCNIEFLLEGKYGFFTGCSNYPKCKFTKNIPTNKIK